MQAWLLRTLQNGEIQRLGADEPRRVNVRVVAATNRHLRDLVAAGSFRADLYHRLSVYPYRSRRCASAVTTFCCWPGAFWNKTAPAWGCAACACPARRRLRCAATTGRAISASSSM